MDISIIVVLIVLLGLAFDYTNGFHDCANVVATVIASKALRPAIAISIAAVFNALGAFQTSRVAQTITTGLVDPIYSTEILVLAALVGAIVWNVITSIMGIPTSSSYALVGGLVGTALMTNGVESILWQGFLFKVVIPMILSPFLGFGIAFLFMKSLYAFVPHSHRNRPLFRYLQIASSALVALAHGFNDAQKSMAIITLGLFAGGVISSVSIPFWVILACALMMGIGTAWGGYRIIHTVGFKITQISPLQGFAAETSSSFVILTAGFLGMPVSATHMIVGSVAGVGTARKVKAVEWLIAHKLVITWILTMPASALIATLAYLLLRLI